MKILIVEDDLEISKLLADFLQGNGYEVLCQYDGLHVLDYIQEHQIDLILLDIMLPYRSGDTILADIRKFSTVPVIVISAKETTKNKIDLLRLGADDYMEKPFDSKELVARVKAVLRRYKPAAAVPAKPAVECVEYPDLTINKTNYSVMYMGKNVDMPPKELELLYFLAASPNHVFSREQLLDQIWGYEYIGDTRTVDVHIKRLREKIKDHANWKIATIWGIGYKFEVR